MKIKDGSSTNSEQGTNLRMIKFNDSAKRFVNSLLDRTIRYSLLYDC